MKTRHHIPDLETQILRPRLLSRIQRQGGLVLVRAPAGFGKTTVLAQWVRSQNRVRDTAWLSLEIRDNCPLPFWQGVIQAFDTIVPGLCNPAREMIRTGRIRSRQDLLITLTHCLQRSARPLILVLDDLHRISEPQIYQGINFLLDHPHAGLTIMAATREMPPLGLSRLRLSDRLTEITEPDLIFSKPEIQDLSQAILDRPLAPAGLDRLARTTEGWAAALKLAILSQEGRPDDSPNHSPDDPPDHAPGHAPEPAWGAGFGRTRMIRDYLMEEVFSHLPVPVQALLKNLAVLDRFCPPLVHLMGKAIPGLPRDPLKFMQARHLFLIPLDDSGHWFRFHHLFQEFLARELHSLGDHEIQALHLAGFYWFESQALLEEAFHHGLAAGRQDLAAGMLDTHAASIYDQGGDQSLTPYLSRLSGQAIAACPALVCYTYGMKVLNLEFKAVKEFTPFLGSAQTDEGNRLLQGVYHLMTAYQDFFCTGDLEAAVKKGKIAIEAVPEEHGSIRRFLEFILTLSFRLTGRLTEARAFTLPREDDDPLASALNIMNRSHLEMEVARLDLAREMVDKEIQAIEAVFSGHPPPLYGFLYITMGMIFRETGRFSRAEAFFHRGLDINGDIVYPEITIISQGEYALFLADAREFTRAHQAADHALGLAAMGNSWIGTLIQAQKQYIWLKQGRPDMVRPWAEKVMTAQRTGFQYHTEQIILARFHMAEQAWPRALATLDSLIQSCESAGFYRQLMEACLLKAKALALSQSPEPPLPWLSQALSLTGKQRYTTLFASELKGMAGLYHALFNAGPGTPHTLTARDLHPALLAEIQAKPGQDEAKKQVMVQEFLETFNKRELTIIDFFRKGASNREIADRLFLSVNTVRWYASRIFAKLGVKRRGQAVSEAIRLGLLRSE